MMAGACSFEPNSPLPFHAYFPFIEELVKKMRVEIITNWRSRADGFSHKSAFANHLLVSFTNRKVMWEPDGFFPETAESMIEELKLAPNPSDHPGIVLEDAHRKPQR